MTTVAEDFMDRKTEATLQDANHCRNRMARLPFAKKYLKEQPQFWKKVLWTEATKTNIYLSDCKSKV